MSISLISTGGFHTAKIGNLHFTFLGMNKDAHDGHIISNFQRYSVFKTVFQISNARVIIGKFVNW